MNMIKETPQRHCGFNPQSIEYNTFNKEIASQARNDEKCRGEPMCSPDKRNDAQRRDGASPVFATNNCKLNKKLYK